jgi:hypothetical protein
MSTEAPSRAAEAAITALPRVRKPGRVPIKSWALDVEGSALEQATNLSNLPFAIGHVALMLDARAGYGMPIGGVLSASSASSTPSQGSARFGASIKPVAPLRRRILGLRL